MKPLVSILVPIYGVEKYIEICAKSILNQTYDNLEIIFINDCTLDNSITVLKNVINQYSNNKHEIKIIEHKENLGLAGARLTALKAAKGEFVLQFDSDDFVDTNIVELLVEKALKDEADIVICDMDHVYETYSTPIVTNPPLNKFELISKLFTGEVHSSLCNKLIKRDLYIKHNIYPTIGLNMCEDLSVMYKLVYFSERISYLPNILYHYRQDVANSFSSQKMPLKHQLNRILLLEQINAFLKEHPEANNSLHHYYKYLFLSNKGEILLYGDLSHMDFFNKTNISICLKDIISHPNLHFNFKTILILHYFKLSPFVLFLRFLQNLKSNIN